MDCELQPQQACRRDLARQVAHDHLAAYAAMVDRDAVFPADNIAALRAAGLLDLLTPTHDGGGAVDWQTFVHVMAEIGGACGSTGLIAIMHCAAMMLLAVRGVTLSRIKGAEHETCKIPDSHYERAKTHRAMSLSAR
jgi:alkylation response protein AidB-like acyl-CoA dehydrogenase